MRSMWMRNEWSWAFVALLASPLGAAPAGPQGSGDQVGHKRVQVTLTQSVGKLSPEARMALATGRARDLVAGARIATTRQAGSTCRVVNVESNSPEACRRFSVPGVSVFYRFQRWADVFVPIGDRAAPQALDAYPGIVWAEDATEIRVPPPPVGKVRPPTRVVPEAIVRGASPA